MILNFIAEFFLFFSEGKLLFSLIFLGLISKEEDFNYPALILLLTMILSSLLKYYFAIPYPEQLVKKLGKTGYVFPSGHMQSCIVFYGWFLLNNKFNKQNWFRISILLLLFGVGISLIYEGYHSFFDIMGAIFFGLLTILIFKQIIGKLTLNFSRVQIKLLFFLVVLILSSFLMLILKVFYEILPHLYMAYYTIIGLTIGNYLIENKLIKNLKFKEISLFLIIMIIFTLVFILQIKTSPLWFGELKWLIIGIIISFLSLAIKKGKKNKVEFWML